jgi:hypothetical protein
MYYIITIIVVIAIICFLWNKMNRRTSNVIQPDEEHVASAAEPKEESIEKAEVLKPVNEMKPIKTPRRTKKTTTK